MPTLLRAASGAGRLGVGVLVGFLGALGCDPGPCATCTQSIDASREGCPAAATCDVLHQIGCAPEEKCAWVATGAGVFCGQIACVRDGTVPLAGACTYHGHDDCVGGLACHQGTCRQICDWERGGDPVCPVQQACLAFESLFGTITLESPAGVCLPR